MGRAEALEAAYVRAHQKGKRGDRVEMGDVLRRWHALGLATGEPLRRVSRSGMSQRIYAVEGGQFRLENDEE